LLRRLLREPWPGLFTAMERIIELQEEYFATDLDIGDHMLSWSEGEVVAYFESGGLSTPADTVSVAPSFSEVQSSADARTVRSMDDARDELLAEDDPADGGAHALGIDEEPALEDAMLDGLMASVPVTTRTLPSSDEACRQQQPAPAHPPPADPLAAYSVKELKEALRRAGVDASSFTEKSELVAAVARLPPASGGAAAAAPPAAAAAATATLPPPPATLRLLRRGPVARRRRRRARRGGERWSRRRTSRRMRTAALATATTQRRS